MKTPQCAVNGCQSSAEVEVFLYTVHGSGEVFIAADSSCPYLCREHVADNERRSAGDRRGGTFYPHTNQSNTRGVSVYLPLTWRRDPRPELAESDAYAGRGTWAWRIAAGIAAPAETFVG